MVLFFRNLFAVALGIVIGSMANGFIIQISGSIIPPPKGIDTSTMEGLKESMQFFEFKHFVMPFLAHAIGTFVGAMIAVLLAKGQHVNRLAYAIAAVFFAGGFYMVWLLPSPMWFNASALILAYFPMSFLAIKINRKMKKEKLLF